MTFEFSDSENDPFLGFRETYIDYTNHVAVVRTTASDGTKTYLKRAFDALNRPVEIRIDADKAEALISNEEN